MHVCFNFTIFEDGGRPVDYTVSIYVWNLHWEAHNCKATFFSKLLQVSHQQDHHIQNGVQVSKQWCFSSHDHFVLKYYNKLVNNSCIIGRSIYFRDQRNKGYLNISYLYLITNYLDLGLTYLPKLNWQLQHNCFDSLTSRQFVREIVFRLNLQQLTQK